MKQKSGLLISLEGSDGSGKSTISAMLKERLDAAGYPVVLTREPGGTAIGEQIREILLNKENGQMCVDTELMLMYAARKQHVHEVILPALNDNKIVLTDRFLDSSFAFQHAGRGMDKQRVEALNQWVLGDFIPDITLIFDVDIETGLERAGKRDKLDRFESEKFAFHQRVYDYYQSLADASDRCVSIDANGTVEQVYASVCRALTSRLNLTFK